MDDLLEEAMVAYAKMRGHLQDEPGQPLQPSHAPPNRKPYPMPQVSPMGSMGGMGGMSGAPLPPPSRRLPTPPPRTAPMPPMGMPMPMGRPSPAPMAPPAQRMAQRTPRLVLTYDGQMFEVDKERFVLGRSKASADLRLADANVSREHAAIERIGSQYVLVDLGSTNGVQVSGERISRHSLSDGDIIAITTHEIRCSFR
ncbi:Adenylate cyclase [Labilithrix luteola]|uniref:Adenylate cyclase n=2 Tax=Labilithrix luteola TaxID=1391654 RepID=A0A0K1PQW4_9BACT|nr:Adenylate cyclase [Labilithrix luteola]